MSKYVREMVLVPKSEQQGGRPVLPPPLPRPPPPPTDPIMQKTQDMPPLYWQRQMLLDQLRTAPALDQAIGLLQDMKNKMGQPTQWPGAGSSEYFRLQNQLQESLPPSKGNYQPKAKAPSGPVGAWQPHIQPVYSSLGETRQQLLKKYPDRIKDVVMPPRKLTDAVEWSKAYDKAWKTVGFPSTVAEYQKRKKDAMQMVKDFNQDMKNFRQEMPSLTPEQQQVEQQKLIDKGRHIENEWHEFQDYIYNARQQASQEQVQKVLAQQQQEPSLLDQVKTQAGYVASDVSSDFKEYYNMLPDSVKRQLGYLYEDIVGRQKGSGTTQYKRPRGWLQE